MRALLIGPVVLVLAACSSGKAPDVAEGGEHIACALHSSADFAPNCAVERLARRQDGDDVVVVRHPDGSFRRFVLIDNGTRIATADGAEELRAEQKGALLEVTVGPNRYRFPSRAPGHAATK